MLQTEQRIAELMAERQQRLGVCVGMEADIDATINFEHIHVPKQSTPSDYNIEKKQHHLRLIFTDQGLFTPARLTEVSDASPRSTTTVYTSIGSDCYTPSQRGSLTVEGLIMSSSPNDRLYPRRTSIDNNQMLRFNRSVSDTVACAGDDRSLDHIGFESALSVEELDCQTTSVDSLKSRRDSISPAVFLYI